MATYTHNGLGGSPATFWYNVGIDGDNPTTATNILFVLPNSDGTFTRINGAGFTYDGNGDPTAGTISSIQRSNDSNGTIIYETVTGLSLSLVALTSTSDNRAAFALIFAGVDNFTGHAGNDLFVGGAGGDTFGGGAGIDTVSYDNASVGVSANLGNNANNTNDALGDTYTAIENLTGSDFNDSLTGNGANNVIVAGLGNDTLNGGNGATTGDDILDGGAGVGDLANYATNATPNTGITVTLSSTSQVVGNAGTGLTVFGTDTLLNIELVRGTSSVDTFTATTIFASNGSLFNEFEGMGGNDIITGNGATRVAYTQALSGVTVDLLAGTAQSIAGGDAAGIGVDSFAGTIGPNNVNRVVAVRGSAFADTISAVGARGSFDFIGGGGNDTFIGSTEAINNFDNNEARYDTGTNNPNAISVVMDAVSTVTDIGGSAFGTDTLTNVERVRGTNLNDTFVANAGFSGPYGAQNFFEGMGGNDTITGNGHTNIRYGAALAAVTVNLQTGIAQGSAGGDAANVGTDTITGGVNQVFGSDFNDTLIGSNGAGAESFNGNAGNDNIDGGGGLLDRVSFRDATAPAGVTVNLTTNTATDGYGGTDTLANIEGAIGSDLNDVITGNGDVNRLQGQGGDDQLFGAGGNDFLVGDDGVDLYAGAFGSGGALFDVGNDVLDGGSGDDQLWGGAGSDILIGGAGTDIIDGGEGSDTVSYASAGSGITARLDTPNVTVAFGLDDSGSFDTYISIENVIGSNFADVINGKGGEVNVLTGGQGDDTLVGEGIDLIFGGAGSDVFFGGQGSALNINLATASIETVWGSFVGDVMDGSTATVNLTMVGQGLTGGANADTMTGGSGDDFIYFRAGDVINGGAGSDWAVATLSASGVTLNMTTTGFENAWGSTSNDSITAAGSATTAVIVGDAGNDTLTGGNAGDFLYGFGDNDTLTGNGGNDNLIGGAGTDTFAFGAAWGTDIVWDWVDGSEQFNMQGSGAANFAALTVDQNYFGSGNAYITFGTNHILVVGGANQITAGDFLF